MNRQPSIAPGIALMLLFGLASACGAQPDGVEPYDSGLRSRDAAWRPRDVPPSDAAPPANYMRAWTADLDHPDASVPYALSEDQILGVIEVLDQGEIRQGNLAQGQASDPRVQAFGRVMMTTHSDAAEQLRSVAIRLGLTAMESSLSQSLRVDYANTAARLSSLSGEAFDREFIQAQVLQHARALVVIDTMLLPNAPDQTLHTALESAVRPLILRHWGEARDLQASLNAP